MVSGQRQERGAVASAKGVVCYYGEWSATSVGRCDFFMLRVIRMQGL